MKLKQPITLELGLSYTFNPVDHLPEDWRGTREDAIEWFRADIAENLHNWVNPRDIYDCIREAKADPLFAKLAALRSVKGSVTIEDGIATLPDGTQINL